MPLNIISNYVHILLATDIWVVSADGYKERVELKLVNENYRKWSEMQQWWMKLRKHKIKNCLNLLFTSPSNMKLIKARWATSFFSYTHWCPHTQEMIGAVCKALLKGTDVSVMWGWSITLSHVSLTDKTVHHFLLQVNKKTWRAAGEPVSDRKVLQKFNAGRFSLG